MEPHTKCLPFFWVVLRIKSNTPHLPASTMEINTTTPGLGNSSPSWKAGKPGFLMNQHGKFPPEKAGTTDSAHSAEMILNRSQIG